MRGFMRSVWLLNPTTPSAGAGAAAQVPTQCLSLGKTALHSSALCSDPAAAVASTAMDFGRGKSATQSSAVDAQTLDAGIAVRAHREIDGQRARSLADHLLEFGGARFRHEQPEAAVGCVDRSRHERVASPHPT